MVRVRDWDGVSLAPGDYAIHPRDGTWYAMTPNGMLAWLKAHQVTEHEDGTITAAPSIKVTGHDGVWHGFLERGQWREC